MSPFNSNFKNSLIIHKPINLVCGVLSDIKTLHVTYEYQLIINTETDTTNGGNIFNVLSTNFTQ